MYDIYNNIHKLSNLLGIKPDVEPEDTIQWKQFDVLLTDGKTGEIVFKQDNVTFPEWYSQQSVDIITSKYFYGKKGTSERESDFRQVVKRITDTIVGWVKQDNLTTISSLNLDKISKCMRTLLYHQYFAYNSPVWFNLGTPHAQQASACFIDEINDNMESIAQSNDTWYQVFRGASGIGVNRSRMRSSHEYISGGGKSSGPCSFAKVSDAIGKVTKSGGKCYKEGTVVSTPYGNIQIQDIKIGDIVNTHLGHKKVIDFMNNGVQSVYKIETKEGYSIEVTSGHKFSYWNNDKMDFDVKPIEEFTEKEQLYLLLSGFAGKEITLDTNIESKPGATTTIDVVLPSLLTPELSYILGLMYGNGYVNEADQFKISFANDDAGELSLSRTMEYSSKLFGFLPRVASGDGNCTIANFDRVLLTRYLKQNGILKGKAHSLVFPQKLMSATKADRYAFIAGLIDTDGSFEKRGGFSLRMIDRDFLSKTQEMLLSLGVPSKLTLRRASKGEWRDLWQLSVVNQIFVEKLYNGINQYSSKAKLLYSPNKVSKGWSFKNLSFKKFLEIVPRGMKEELDNKFSRCNLTVPYSAIKFYAEEYPGSPIGNACAKLLTVVPLNIVAITEIGEHNTYDIEVEDVHMLSANGFYASNSRRAAIMELLDAEHGDVRKFIHQKREEERKAKALIAAGWSADFDDPDGAYGSVFFQNSNQSVRLSSAFMVNLQEKFPWYTLEVRPTENVFVIATDQKERQTHQGMLVTDDKGNQYIRKGDKYYKVIEKLDTQDLMDEIAQCAWETADPGVQFSDTINWWHTCPGDGKIEGSNPCSEYFFLNNTACNLASMNLMKFLREDNTFNTELFTAVVGLLVLTMDAIVSGADYPTQTIAKATRRYRTLGIGYTNLGAMLMVMGLPYDSNIARLVAGEITARMTLSAYAFSHSLANIIGEAECFSPGNDENREAIKKVVGMHVSEYEDNVYNNVEYYGHLFDEDSYSLTQHILNIQQYGFPCRNAQVTVLAPTGTISFIMGCDTTGIEPAFSLVSYKKLVGGNVMKLVTDCVRESLRRLSKSDDFRGHDVEEIIKEFMETGKLTKVPAKYLPIFRTAVGDDAISYEAHLLMMQATQRFLSGGISKTVNMPANSTVEDVKNVYLKAWNMGIKSVALYRDGCKASQPMNTSLDKKEDSSAQILTHSRRKLPAVVKSDRYKFEIGGAIDGYIHIGLFEDGQPGEIFIRTSKQGSTLNGLFDAWATMVSMSLQYGVPLDVIVEKHKNSKFEPAGLTNYKNKEMRFATSVLDFVAKLLQFYYMDGREDAVSTPAIPEPADMKVEKVNGEVCSNCGGTLQNAGSCHVCTSCGETTGCG